MIILDFFSFVVGKGYLGASAGLLGIIVVGTFGDSISLPSGGTGTAAPKTVKVAAPKKERAVKATGTNVVEQKAVEKKKAATKKVKKGPYDLSTEAEEVKVAEKDAKATAKVAQEEKAKEAKADAAAKKAAEKEAAAAEAGKTENMYP